MYMYLQEIQITNGKETTHVFMTSFLKRFQNPYNWILSGIGNPAHNKVSSELQVCLVVEENMGMLPTGQTKNCQNVLDPFHEFVRISSLCRSVNLDGNKKRRSSQYSVCDNCNSESENKVCLARIVTIMSEVGLEIP